MKAFLSLKDPNKRKQRKIFIIFGAVSFLLLVASYLLVGGMINVGSVEAMNTYNEVKKELINKIYKEYYDKFYNIAKNANHVSNEATINIERTQELARLEVLKVSDVEFIVDNADDNEENITVWHEFSGEGIFTVDLAGSEFLTDNERKYVIARIPKPKLTNIKIDKENSKLLKWDNDVFNDSIEKGEALAQKNIEEAQELIKQKLVSNQGYYNSAKIMAENLIVNIVKGWNPDIPDLEVVVEFVE